MSCLDILFPVRIEFSGRKACIMFLFLQYKLHCASLLTKHRYVCAVHINIGKYMHMYLCFLITNSITNAHQYVNAVPYIAPSNAL